MRKTVILKYGLVAAMLAFAAAAAPAEAKSKYLSWQGQWALDTAKTHYPTGFPKITRNDMNVTKDDGKILQFTDTLTMDGKDVTATFDGAFDGKFHPAGDGQEVAYHRVSNKTIGGVRKNAAGFTTENSACTIADDESKTVCHIEVFMKPGDKPIVFDEYFDRVKS